MVKRIIYLVKQQYGHPIKYLYNDSEPSLKDAFNVLIRENNIITEPTALYITEQNGLFERFKGVIITKSKYIRIASKLPYDL